MSFLYTCVKLLTKAATGVYFRKITALGTDNVPKVCMIIYLIGRSCNYMRQSLKPVH